MVQNYIFDAQNIIFKSLKEVILHITIDKKEERDQLLKVIHKHSDYVNYPDSIGLKNKIADNLIREKKYCF
jgi:hypothetical protein